MSQKLLSQLIMERLRAGEDKETLRKEFDRADGVVEFLDIKEKAR